jgi:Ca2+-binding RTX toxin-like protein
VLNGGLGADILIGGLGNDTYVVDDAGDLITEAFNEGVDLVQASVSHTLAANLENLTLTGTANLNGVGNALNNVITGNDGANTLDGADGADTLIGGAASDVLLGGLGNDKLQGGLGNDTLNGGAGNDTVDGGAGADLMSGGLGNDDFIVDDLGDQVFEGLNEGTDLVKASVSFTLGANIENLTLTGVDNINGTGNALGNTLMGNAGANVLNGGDGNDTLNGAAGNDSLWGGTGNDRMTGGLGADVFVVSAGDIRLTRSGLVAARDTLVDLTFAQGDRIDLSGVDANTALAGDQAFTFVGSFTNQAGQATLTYTSGSNTTLLKLDVDGDGKADYEMVMNGNHTVGDPVITGASAQTDGGWIL